MSIEYLNLKNGYGSAEVAVHQLLFSVASLYSRGGGIIKIEHGEDKKIKTEIRKAIRALKKSKKIKCMVWGEKFYSGDDTVRYICDKFTEVSSDKDINHENRQIAIILV